MITSFPPYKIKFFDHQIYSPESVDNPIKFSQKYLSKEYTELGFRLAVKLGIIVSLELEEENLGSAIICEVGGVTSPHPNSYIISENQLLTIACNKVFCLTLPDLELNWMVKCDDITCFSINQINGNFIIHGELQITSIDINGRINWVFAPGELLITYDNEREFQINEKGIFFEDFSGTIYLLNENGEILEKR